MRGDSRPRGRALRAQIALAFDLPLKESKRTRALVLALVAGVMESQDVAAQARKANRDNLAAASREGVDRGAALCVQLALDGYLLCEAFHTIKIDREDREALRATLHALVEATPVRSARRGRSHRGARR